SGKKCCRSARRLHSPQPDPRNPRKSVAEKPFALFPALSAQIRPCPRRSVAKKLLPQSTRASHPRRATTSQLLNGVLPYSGRKSTARPAPPSAESSSARVG